jgi:hypothetical protein
MNEPIFSVDFLKEHIPANHLNTVVGLRKKRDIIRNWSDSFQTNKIDYFKEEEVKSRFIMEMFGDVLGFNYRNPGVWLSREEVKTDSDATKPDGALGVFRTTSSGVHNTVYVVIEIKGTESNLDQKQNRPDHKVTPVEQAFSYAPKMGGKCKWVVVSNFKDIRFYHHSDAGHYQSYTFGDLANEDRLREFLFLFHKDNWTSEYTSVTDKLYALRNKPSLAADLSGHILDQLYHTLFKFEGLEFIDPNYVANLKPFNVLNDYVWHFRDNTLYTLNTEIGKLIAKVNNTGTELVLTQELEQELKVAGVTDYLKKLRYVLSRLYQFLIRKVVALKDVDLAIISKDADQLRQYRRSGYIGGMEHVEIATLAHEIEDCDCINCNYRSLDFKRMIRKTKAAKRNEKLSAKELAYAHYELATDNYKECYDIYKQAEQNSKGVEDKNVEYFLTKINLSYLYNLVSGHDDDNSEILSYIKQIDLDRSLHQELDVYVDEDVRRYLTRVKEFQLFNDIEKKIAELLEEIKDKQDLYESNGHYSGPNHLALLNHQYHLLYSHFHKNYLIYDAFPDFKKAVTHVFEGLVISYRTKNYGLTQFSAFYLTEAVLYIHHIDLIGLLEDTTDLAIEPDELEQFVNKAEAFLNSQFDRHQFGVVANSEVKAQLTNYNFKYKFENMFSNVFTLLSHLVLTDEQTSRLVQPIIDFVETEDYLAHYDLRQLGLYLERHGKAFKRSQVVDLLKFAIGNIRRGYIKYDSFIDSLCKHYILVSGDRLLNEQSLIRRAIANQTDDLGRFNFRDLLEMYPILDEAGQGFFKDEMLVELNRNFEAYYYTELLERKIITWDEGDFFTKFTQQMSRANYDTDPLLDGETYDLRNTNMVNFLAYYHLCGVPADYPALQGFQNLSEFATWGLNPEIFDYEKFDPRWLLVLYPPELMKRIAKIPPAKEKISAYLRDKPDSKLATTYIRYFI